VQGGRAEEEDHGEENHALSRKRHANFSQFYELPRNSPVSPGFKSIWIISASLMN
jgi:hypothetical protein